MVASILTSIYKSSGWAKILLLLCLAVLTVVVHNSHRRKIQEGFTEGFIQGFSEDVPFVLKQDGDAFDDFYAGVYDDLLYNDIKNKYEIGQIINKTVPSSASIILDVGSGTGHHAGQLKAAGFEVQGVDISPAMVAKASQNYPDVPFHSGNVLTTMLYPADSFTHITCLYFTIYQIKDKLQFLRNCYRWLMPGGHLIIHLVDREKFDPIVPAASVLLGVSPQKYAKNRITTSSVVFNNFDYKAEFEEVFPNDLAIFREVFKDKKSNRVRQHEHKLYMPTHDNILAAVKDVGFIIIGKIDLKDVSYDNQYLYILQKPE